MEKRKWIPVAVLFCVIGLNLALGLPRLAHYSAVDEPYWTYDRISQYWTAISKHKWKSTNINDKPGITVALISGPGLLSIDPMAIKDLRDNPKTPELVKQFLKVNFSFRLPVYLFALLGIILLYFFLRPVFGERTALLATVFTGLSPIILGISLIINPDSILWIFTTLSILSFFARFKTNEKKYLILSGIFLGLALLTKYVANILFVYFFALIFLQYIFEKKESLTASQYFKKSFLDLLIIAFVSVAVFAILFPATWKSPGMILEGTLLSDAFKPVWKIFLTIITLVLLDAFFLNSKILAYPLELTRKYKNILVRIGGIVLAMILAVVLVNTYSGMKVFDFQGSLASPKSGDGFQLTPSRFSDNFFAGFYALVFGLTPLVFLSMLFAIYKETLTKNLSKNTPYILYLALFIILYYTGSSVNGVGATVRYQIALYPLAMILAAIGFESLWAKFEAGKFKKIFQPHFLYPALILIGAFSLFSVRPFYFTYASWLLPQQYILNLKGMGDGNYEAAQYLNSLPDAQNLTIWSDKGAVCETFMGRCLTGFNKKDVAQVNFDYLVSSADRESRSMKMPPTMSHRYDFDSLYSSKGGNFMVVLDGRPDNFVKVVNAKEIAKNDRGE